MNRVMLGMTRWNMGQEGELRMIVVGRYLLYRNGHRNRLTSDDPLKEALWL